MTIFINLIIFLFTVARILDKRVRFVFLLVVLFAIISPILDLAFFKLLASLFTNKDIQSLSIYETIPPLVVVLVVLNIFKYLTKIKKVEFVNKVIEKVTHISQHSLGGNINWLRVVILETTNSAISIAHILIVTFISLIISPVLGGVLLTVIVISFFVLNYLFYIEVFNQRKIRYNKKVKAFKKGEMNVISRIRSSEKSTIIINTIVLAFFITLILCYSHGIVASHDALLFLFITRFISSNLSNVSSSFMRMSRGWASVSDRFEHITISVSEYKQNRAV